MCNIIVIITILSRTRYCLVELTRSLITTSNPLLIPGEAISVLRTLKLKMCLKKVKVPNNNLTV